jgi:hypothetical protein
MHPDLTTPINRTPGPEKPRASGNGRLKGDHGGPVQGGSAPIPSKTVLEPEASAELRDRAVAELSGLGSSDDMAIWAHRCLAEKNKPIAADAERVGEAFQARLATPPRPGPGDAPQAQEAAPGGLQGQNTRKSERLGVRPRSSAVNKSLLTLPEPRRVRDRDHVRSVAKRPCLICGRQPSDAHHLRFAQSRALGRKVSDEFTVPLCRGHHREIRRSGDEAAWWKETGIDPTVPARALWLETHPLPTAQREPTSPKYRIKLEL